jgi:hypothetical protein
LGDRLAGLQAEKSLKQLLMTPRLATPEDAVGAHLRLADLAELDGRWADCISGVGSAVLASAADLRMV